MPYTILVREAGSSRPDPEVLAYDIKSASQARRIVHNLASSYNEFGHNPQSSVYWFKGTGGRHEIWIAPAK